MSTKMSLKLIIGIIIVSVGLLVGMSLLLSSGEDLSPDELSETSPKAVTSETLIDIGTMKVSDESKTDFLIKNEGKEPLKISGMTSSCGCTVGQFVYQDKTSREFGMHAESGYLGEIAPGEEAIIRITYRPSQMPVYGPVERSVSVVTNDPLNQKLTFTISARVE